MSSSARFVLRTKNLVTSDRYPHFVMYTMWSFGTPGKSPSHHKILTNPLNFFVILLLVTSATIGCNENWPDVKHIMRCGKIMGKELRGNAPAARGSEEVRFTQFP